MNDPIFPSENDPESYTVRHCEHGIAVFGSVPISELPDMAESWEQTYGYDLLRADIAHAVGASFVVTDEESGEAWREAIEQELEERYDDPLLRWSKGCDAGQSALTMFSVLRGVSLSVISRSGRPSEPADAADFGRCARLLEIAPDKWRDRLDEVAAKHPAWTPIVEHWSELEELYESDRGALTERLREVRDV